MSTSVNIAVKDGGDGNLLERSRLQINGNRQSKVEADARANVEATGTEQRKSRRLAIGASIQGNAANDSNPYGTPFIPELPLKELSASPLQPLKLGQFFSEVSVNADGTYTLLIKTLNGNEYTFQLGSFFSVPTTDYIINSGIGFYTGTTTQTYDPIGVNEEPLFESWDDPTFVEFGGEPPPWGSWSRTSTNEIAVTARSIYTSIDIVLPIAKETFIWVVAGKGDIVRATATQIITESYSYSLAQTTPSVRYYNNYAFDRSIATNIQEGTTQYIKCFTINNSAVREITVPEALELKINKYLQTRKITATWGYRTDSNVILSNENGVQTTGNDTVLTGVEFNQTITEPEGLWDAKVNLYRFLVTGGAFTEPTTTPGVYEALATAPNDPRFYDETIMDSVPNIVENFYSGSYASIPKFGLQATYVPFSPSVPDSPYIIHQFTRSRPTTTDILPESELRRTPNLKTSILNTYSWDWGKSGYCRQQALALGFTAADLTP
jgi:hypothetical protein